jgi:hypothetical protein
MPAHVITPAVLARFQDSVEFLGKPDYVYRVKRVFPDAPERTITIEIKPADLPRHTGAFARRTRVEIVLEKTRPTLDRLMVLDGV